MRAEELAKTAYIGVTGRKVLADLCMYGVRTVELMSTGTMRILVETCVTQSTACKSTNQM